MSNLKSWELKDRAYVLRGNKTPLTWRLQVRHTERKPLLYFDEKQGINRALRYATNQNSLFVDEQDGNVTLEHVIFVDGSLVVPRNNPLLQQFLSVYHPAAGRLWEELDNEKEAKDEIDYIEEELQAMSLVQDLDVDVLEGILRSEVGSSVSGMSSKEIKRDCYILAKSKPDLFIKLANDEDIQYRSFANRAVELGLIKLSNDNTEFQYKNTRKIFTVPFGENPYSALARWFKTDEGTGVYTNLQKKME